MDTRSSEGKEIRIPGPDPSLMLAITSYGFSYVQTAYSDFVPPMGML